VIIAHINDFTGFPFDRLVQHTQIKEGNGGMCPRAVVAGIPHPVRGESVKAYGMLKPGEKATADELIAYCKEQLAAYKVPTALEFRSELPKSMVGKFLRRVLVEDEKAKMAR